MGEAMLELKRKALQAKKVPPPGKGADGGAPQPLMYDGATSSDQQASAAGKADPAPSARSAEYMEDFFSEINSLASSVANAPVKRQSLIEDVPYTCPGGHPLVTQVATAGKQITCDGCRKPVPAVTGDIAAEGAGAAGSNAGAAAGGSAAGSPPGGVTPGSPAASDVGGSTGRVLAAGALGCADAPGSTAASGAGG